jgi:mannose-6-phosphate isomerase-like protein (cupin superfamily)
MFVKKGAMRIEQRVEMRGGEGTVTLNHFVEDGAHPHVKMAAELTLPPGASIGRHSHATETEFFVFLEGTALVNDNGTEVTVQKGDVIITGGGAFHSVTNTGSVPLVLNAFIIPD